MLSLDPCLPLPAELTDRIAPISIHDGKALDLARPVPSGPQEAYLAACRRGGERCAELYSTPRRPQRACLNCVSCCATLHNGRSADEA
jgi:hypothetical protein